MVGVDIATEVHMLTLTKVTGLDDGGRLEDGGRLQDGGHLSLIDGGWVSSLADGGHIKVGMLAIQIGG